MLYAFTNRFTLRLYFNILHCGQFVQYDVFTAYKLKALLWIF